MREYVKKKAFVKQLFAKAFVVQPEQQTIFDNQLVINQKSVFWSHFSHKTENYTFFNNY